MKESREDGFVRRVQPNDDRNDRSSPEPDEGGLIFGGGDEGEAAGGKDKKSEDAEGERDDSGGGDKKKKKKSSPKSVAADLQKKLQRIHMGLTVGLQAARSMLMAQMLLYLKAFLQALVAVVQAAAAAVTTAVMTIVQTVATVIGVSIAVAVGGILGVVLVAVVSFVVLTDGYNAGEVARLDSTVECNTDSSFMRVELGDPSEQELSNAKRVYAFLRAYGLADENIAGVLGNWQAESHIDPTSVETIYTEPYLPPISGYGERKSQAWKGSYSDYGGVTRSPADFKMVSNTVTVGGVTHEYGLVTLQTTWNGASRFANYHASYPAINYIGIGLGQWTNGRNRYLLEFADRWNLNWYDLETQLLFMLIPHSAATGGDDPWRVNMLTTWAPEDTPESAARYFQENWEGIDYSDYRGEYAREWFARIGTWVEGVDYDMSEAQSLLAMVESAGAVGANRSGSAGLRSCSGFTYADNSSAAAAAVAFSWGPGEAYDNDGTACWQHIFNAIVGDQYIRCCDRTVSTALKWSGTDSSYPNGAVQHQEIYAIASPRWQKIDWGGDVNNLLPGDVMIRYDDEVGHTLMYVGNDIVKAKFGETYNGLSVDGYVCVSGSRDEYSPHVHKWSTSGDESSKFQTYDIYRCIEKHNDKPEWTSLTCVS